MNQNKRQQFLAKNMNNLRDDINFMYERVKTFGLGIHATYKCFIDVENKTIIGNNHLKCMIRNDYKQNNSHLKGRELNDLIDIFMNIFFEEKSIEYFRKQQERKLLNEGN